jgi:hypothetical protein
MEALQVLKFALKKSRLNFTGHLTVAEHPPSSDGGGAAGDEKIKWDPPRVTLMEMLGMKPDALGAFLSTANFVD